MSKQREIHKLYNQIKNNITGNELLLNNDPNMNFLDRFLEMARQSPLYTNDLYLDAIINILNDILNPEKKEGTLAKVQVTTSSEGAFNCATPVVDTIIKDMIEIAQKQNRPHEIEIILPYNSLRGYLVTENALSAFRGFKEIIELEAALLNSVLSHRNFPYVYQGDEKIKSDMDQLFPKTPYSIFDNFITQNEAFGYKMSFLSHPNESWGKKPIDVLIELGLVYNSKDKFEINHSTIQYVLEENKNAWGIENIFNDSKILHATFVSDVNSFYDDENFLVKPKSYLSLKRANKETLVMYKYLSLFLKDHIKIKHIISKIAHNHDLIGANYGSINKGGILSCELVRQEINSILFNSDSANIKDDLSKTEQALLDSVSLRLLKIAKSWSLPNHLKLAILNGTYLNISVTKIGDRAFYGCENLKSITIPNSVTEIGEGAFDGCENLEINIEYDTYKKLKHMIPHNLIAGINILAAPSSPITIMNYINNSNINIIQP